MNTRIEVGAEEFNDFLRCLNALREICTDVDIQNGIVRQRSNDHTSVFEMNMTTIVNNISLPISDLKKKLDLLKTFSGQSVYIEINKEENDGESYFVFSDDFSSLKFMFPFTDLMDNKFMSEEERDGIFNLDEDNLILSNELNSTITERVRITTSIYNTQALQIKFSNNIASITATTQSKDQYASFKSDIPTNMDFDGEYISNISTIPFKIEHDSDLEFKMYKDPSQNVSLNKIKTEIGSVEVNIYSRSAIVEDNE